MKFKRSLNFLKSELKIAEDSIYYCDLITQYLNEKNYEKVFYKDDPTKKEIEFKLHDMVEMKKGWVIAKEELEYEISELEMFG